MTVNKAIIVGRLGADPETGSTSSGTTVCKMSVATSRTYDGDEETEWHDVTVFGGTAEACARYLKKGRQVYVEGRIEYDSWQDDSGEWHNKTQIVARNVTFLEGSSGDDSFDDDIPY